MMSDVLHNKYGLEYLLPNRLNQDCVENLFSVIRHKGAQRDNPDAGQFRAASRQCMVDSVMLPGKNAKCIGDVDKFLLTLKNVNTITPPAPTPVQRSSNRENVPENVKSILAVCALPPEARNQHIGIHWWLHNQ